MLSEFDVFPLLLENLNDVTYRFINRFRNPAKLQSEAGYYLSSLVRIYISVMMFAN